MTKLSIASRVFEWTLHRIFPKDNDAWLKRLRRRIYYSILNDWGNYGYCVTMDKDGEEKEGAKVTLTGFILWTVGGTVRGISSHIYTRSGLAPWICKRYGHKLVDYSSGGPDSGNMDHACIRCGKHWHVPLY